MQKCDCCGKKARVMCKSGVCKKCHISCSWKDCIDGTYVAKIMLKGGYTKKEIKSYYPKARI